jgi:hypothetical protein
MRTHFGELLHVSFFYGQLAGPFRPVNTLGTFTTRSGISFGVAF